MACAVISALFLPDFPVTTKRFSDRERQLAVDRLAADNVMARTEDNSGISFLEALQKSLGNWRTWFLTVGYMVSSLTLVHSNWNTNCPRP